jgi:hypothetical protein
MWAAGSSVEVGWTVKASHGGGYSYRLCPADHTLDEECFQRTPLRFVGRQSFRWGGAVRQPQCSDLLYEVHRSHRCKVHRNHRNGAPGHPLS